MEREFHFFVEPEICSDDSDSEGSEGSEDLFGDAGDQDGVRSLIVRLDKWLWAARFFKTRALARAAVEAGKVFYNGERSKPSREIEVGAILQIRHGRFEKTVIVKGLSTRRRSTDEALQLFEETEESKSLREQQAIDFPQNQFNQSHSGYNQPSAYFNNEQAQERPRHFLRRAFSRGAQDPRQDIRTDSRPPQHRPRSAPTYPNPYPNPNHSGRHQPYPNHQNSHNQQSNHAHHNHQSGYNNPVYPTQNSGYNHPPAYPQQNDNNPVYGTRPNHSGHHSGYNQNYHTGYNNGYNQNQNHNNARYNHSNHPNSVSKNKTEPQTELE